MKEIFIAISIILSYILGSIPFGYLYGIIFKGQDIRKLGSKNIGSSNAKRLWGWKAWIFTTIGDFGKGLVSVLLFPFIINEFINIENIYSLVQVLCGISVVLGHSFSLFLNFKGGKGVNTTAGVFVVLSPIAFFDCLDYCNILKKNCFSWFFVSNVYFPFCCLF